MGMAYRKYHLRLRQDAVRFALPGPRRLISGLLRSPAPRVPKRVEVAGYNIPPTPRIATHEEKLIITSNKAAAAFSNQYSTDTIFYYL